MSQSAGDIEFLDLPRGGKKLCYKGYCYTHKAMKKSRVRWECSQRAAFGCKGAVTTSLQVDMFISYCYCF